MDALGCRIPVVTPAFPDNGRTVFKGHLFVGDVLLSDSGMRNHPLTPMTDANLVRVLQAQCRRRVGLVEQAVVARGDAAIRAGMPHARRRLRPGDRRRRRQRRPAGARPRLQRTAVLCAGSGVAIGLPQNWNLALAPMRPGCRRSPALGRSFRGAARRRRWPRSRPTSPPAMPLMPSIRCAWAAGRTWSAKPWHSPSRSSARGPVLVYSSAVPDAVAAVQRTLGVADAGAAVEQALAAVARGLVDAGVRQLVVAGGETSGACIQALGVERLRIGPQIDPGVPWCHAAAAGSRPALHLALKSGNFGGVDFFSRAFEVLKWRPPSKPARGDLPRRPLALRPRLCPRHDRQRQRAPRRRRRLPDHPDRRQSRQPRSGDDRPRRSRRRAARRRPREQDAGAASRHLRRRSLAGCVLHTHSTHLVALTLAGVWSSDSAAAADHAVFRDEGRRTSRSSPTAGWEHPAVAARSPRRIERLRRRHDAARGDAGTARPERLASSRRPRPCAVLEELRRRRGCGCSAIRARRLSMPPGWPSSSTSSASPGSFALQSFFRTRASTKISQAARNIAAITGPITKPWRPKIARPPSVVIRTR